MHVRRLADGNSPTIPSILLYLLQEHTHPYIPTDRHTPVSINCLLLTSGCGGDDGYLCQVWIQQQAFVVRPEWIIG